MLFHLKVKVSTPPPQNKIECFCCDVIDSVGESVSLFPIAFSRPCMKTNDKGFLRLFSFVFFCVFSCDEPHCLKSLMKEHHKEDHCA